MEEEVRQNVERTGAPSERMGDLFLKIFGPDRGVDLERSERQPHEPVQLSIALKVPQELTEKAARQTP